MRGLNGGGGKGVMGLCAGERTSTFLAMSYSDVMGLQCLSTDVIQ